MYLTTEYNKYQEPARKLGVRVFLLLVDTRPNYLLIGSHRTADDRPTDQFKTAGEGEGEGEGHITQEKDEGEGTRTDKFKMIASDQIVQIFS